MNRPRLYCCIICLAFISCADADQNSAVFSDPGNLERILIGEYGGRIIVRRGELLEIHCRNGVKKYENTESSTYRAVDSYQVGKINFLLISAQAIPPYFELINLDSGKVLGLASKPVFSPGDSRLIDVSLDLEVGELTNSIALYKITKDGFEKEWSYLYKEPKGPSNPVWLSDTEFLYLENFYVNGVFSVHNLRRQPVVVKYKNQTWNGPASIKNK